MRNGIERFDLILILFLFAFGISSASVAHAGPEPGGGFDGDLVPDGFDNCSALANGPGDPSNQIDSDLDGYGNACDTDYSNDGVTTTSDFANFFLPAFTGADWIPATDHTGDRLTTTLDFTVFLAQFQSPPGAPGPSGLACAGSIPCLP